MTTSPYEELRKALEPADWTTQAACADPGLNPDLWFAPRRQRAARITAKAVCARCPVQAECAIDGQGQEGIWGGKVSKAVRRRQSPAHRARVLTP